MIQPPYKANNARRTNLQEKIWADWEKGLIFASKTKRAINEYPKTYMKKILLLFITALAALTIVAQTMTDAYLMIYFSDGDHCLHMAARYRDTVDALIEMIELCPHR